MSEAKWYVVHTYSGYENKVKANIEKTIENRKLQDQILEVSVPLEEVVEVKNGVKKQVQKKLFPGYVLLNMIMNDDTWYVVRNTRGVTGFVGPGSKPVPLTDAEMKSMGVHHSEVQIDLEESPLHRNGKAGVRRVPYIDKRACGGEPSLAGCASGDGNHVFPVLRRAGCRR